MNNNSNISRREFIRTTALGAAGTATGALMLTNCTKEKDTPWYTIPRKAMNIIGAMSYPSQIEGYQNEYGVSSNTEYRGWVTQSRDHIRDVVNTEDSAYTEGFAWNVDLYASEQVNAWCMPGARMAFYEGIIPLCSNASGVAIVMGHEVAHAVRNHAGQRLGMQLGVTIGLKAIETVANLALGDKLDPEIIEIAMKVFAIGGQFGMLAYSRSHEHEADRMGLMYAAKAGYNPTEAPRFWQRMESRFGSSSTPNFLSTHPSHKDRSKRLNDLQKEALDHYENSNKIAIKDRIKNLNDAMDEAYEHYKQAIS